MSLAAQLKEEFFHAAHADEDLRMRPIVPVDRKVLEEITKPIKEFLQNDPVYGEFETGAGFQMESVLQLMQDAWVREVNDDKSEYRNGLRDALQGIMEDVIEADGSNTVSVDFADMFGIVKYREAINDAADIHERFMGNETLAKALRAFSDNIASAQDRNWTPAFDHTQASANDEIYHQPKQA